MEDQTLLVGIGMVVCGVIYIGVLLVRMAMWRRLTLPQPEEPQSAPIPDQAAEEKPREVLRLDVYGPDKVGRYRWRVKAPDRKVVLRGSPNSFATVDEAVAEARRVKTAQWVLSALIALLFALPAVAAADGGSYCTDHPEYGAEWTELWAQWDSENRLQRTLAYSELQERGCRFEIRTNQRTGVRDEIWHCARYDVPCGPEAVEPPRRPRWAPRAPRPLEPKPESEPEPEPDTLTLPQWLELVQAMTPQVVTEAPSATLIRQPDDCSCEDSTMKVGEATECHFIGTGGTLWSMAEGGKGGDARIASSPGARFAVVTGLTEGLVMVEHKPGTPCHAVLVEKPEEPPPPSGFVRVLTSRMFWTGVTGAIGGWATYKIATRNPSQPQQQPPLTLPGGAR